MMRLSLLLATLLLVLAACGGDGGGSGDAGDAGGTTRAETSADEGAPCEEGRARTAEELTADLPSGFSTGPAPRDTMEDFRKQLATADEDKGKVVRLTGKQVRRRGKPVALVIVIETDQPTDRDDLVAGAEDGSGKEARPAPLGDDAEGGRIIVAGDGGASLFGVPDTCSGLIVLGVSRAVTEQVGRALSV